MSRNLKKRKRDPYSTNFERLSIYPSYKRTEPSRRESKQSVREGSIVRIRITGVDDEGRPTGLYLGYEIAIENAPDSLEPGETVRVIIKRIRGRKAYGALDNSLNNSG